MFSRDQIEKVRTSTDIVETVREYVPSLQVMGRSVKGLCPFHNERTPSFHVQAERGFYKCFGCGEAGDVITFVSKMEQISFVEAVEKLASAAGIPLKREKTFQAGEPEGVREKLHRALEAARDLYRENLWDERLGEPGRVYLAERGILDRTVEDFQLGFAPQGQSIFEQLVKKGFSLELLQQAGLVTRAASGRLYDPLFGRLIFPILDGFGHVVGFGGRVMPQTKKGLPGLSEEERDEGPKYINSPESPVFSKGKLLYGLSQAKTHLLAGRKAVIMEGYMDVIGTHQGGVPIAVATLGTALTRDHAKLLKRYVDEAIAFFDADEAGKRAAFRGLEPLLQELIFPRVVMTNEAGDPDEIIIEHGKEYFEQILKDAPDFVDYLLKTRAAGAQSLQEKSQVASEILAVVAQSPNEILKSEWTARVSAGLNLDRTALERELSKKKSNAAPVPVEKPAPVMKKPARKMPTTEDELLQLLFHSPSLLADDDLSPKDFPEERQQKLFSLMTRLSTEGKVSLPALNDEMPENLRLWAQELLLEEKSFPDPSERKSQLVRNIRVRQDKERLATLSQQLAQEMNTALLEEYKSLLKRVKGSNLNSTKAGI